MDYRCVSADSHLEILPEKFTHRVPDKYKDRAPKVITLPEGLVAVAIEGSPLNVVSFPMAQGKPFEERRPYDPLPGADYYEGVGIGTPEERLAEQDIDGVDCEVLYPGASGPTSWRKIKDDAAYLSVVRAYNDWLAEEYCSVNPERLVGLGVIPDSNLEDALVELRHCRELGLKGVVVYTFPSGNPYPVMEDDRFWQEATDMAIPLTLHVQFGFPLTGPVPSPIYKYPKHAVTHPELDAGDFVARYNKYGIRGALQATQMISHGVFDRVPDLKMYVAEVQCGWLPNWLEQLDNEWGRHHFWVERVLGLPKLDRWPSEYGRDHFWWGFTRNAVGVRTVKAELGLDKIMWASDFPHLESDWPYSQKVIEESCAVSRRRRSTRSPWATRSSTST